MLSSYSLFEKKKFVKNSFTFYYALYYSLIAALLWNYFIGLFPIGKELAYT